MSISGHEGKVRKPTGRSASEKIKLGRTRKLSFSRRYAKGEIEPWVEERVRRGSSPKIDCKYCDTSIGGGFIFERRVFRQGSSLREECLHVSPACPDRHPNCGR